MSKLYTPRHQAIRMILRVGGPVVTLFGVILLGVGLVGILSSLNSEQPPVLSLIFLLAGIALVCAGVVVCIFGYLAIIIRYIAADSMPVVFDAISDVEERRKISHEPPA
jgi:hypothetical protein